MNGKCEACGVPWCDHPGIAATCAALKKSNSDRDHFRREVAIYHEALTGFGVTLAAMQTRGSLVLPCEVHIPRRRVLDEIKAEVGRATAVVDRKMAETMDWLDCVVPLPEAQRAELKGEASLHVDGLDMRRAGKR